MPAITVSIDVLGMSGRPWRKIGTCHSVDDACAFIEQWWRDLSFPFAWTLEIDGLEYCTNGILADDHPRVRSHIEHCVDLHRAFFLTKERQ